MKKKEYESLVNELKGNRLLKVLYYEAEYNNTEIYWNRNSEFDSLDFGLDLITDSGRCFGIIWGSEFFQYGVSIKNHSLKKELSSYRSFNVTSEIKWSLLLNSKIIKTKVIWSWVINTEKQNKIYYPQDLILEFENGKNIIVSATEIREKEVLTCIDHITVFFNKENTLKYKVEK